MFRHSPSRLARRRLGLTGIVAHTPLLLALGGALCIAAGTLLWLGYRATVAQQRSELMLAERRANETLALLIAALDRDMKGAQLSILLPMSQEQLVGGGSADLAALAARAFARFPYPETFFVWRRRGTKEGNTYVFNRADRLPPWDSTVETTARYPVVTHRDQTALDPLIQKIRRDAVHRQSFAAYQLPIAKAPYQIVVHLLHDGTGPAGLVGLVGYTVNLTWARGDYFREILRQVSRIGGEDGNMAITINDAQGSTIASTRSQWDSGVTRERHFSLRFFDNSLTTVLPADSQAQQWTAQVTSFSGNGELGAFGGRAMFSLMALAALASVIGVAVIARALAVSSELIAMKSDFVSTVTHELKTPLSLMRLIADSLVTGRYRGPEKIHEYGELLSAEVARMTSLIDNLLTYARLNGVKNDYVLVPIDLVELLEEAAANCQPRLTQLGFTLEAEISHETITVTGDRTELLHVLNNLLDNSIKYSSAAPSRAVVLRARRAGSTVLIEVEDRGSGIHADDLPLVFEKFFRGRDAHGGGSGLGLAIVNRIVKNHGGSVEIKSSIDQGTTVIVALPAPEFGRAG